ncbi:hypothetical protein B566_EDAN004675 [Ephemera danica]|nr:hypothetical protein B566_EDAN004675 [Ephemera danica]
MVQYCAAYGCSNNRKDRDKNEEKYSFHKFPLKNKVLCQKWIQALKRANFRPSKHSVLCSDHFESTCFFTTGWTTRKCLNEDAQLNNTQCRENIIVGPINLSANCIDDDINNAQQLPPPQTQEKRYLPCVDTTRENITATETLRNVDDNEPLDLRTSTLSTTTKRNSEMREGKERLKLRYKRSCKKIVTLENIISSLKENNLASETACDLLLASVPDSAKPILERMLSGKLRGEYPPELRSFAITLSFYSTKAYEYVRKTFNNSLPNTRTLEKWYQTVDASPGFHTEAMNAISLRVQEAELKGEKVLLSLMVDGMSIKKKIELVGSEVCGYVDFGATIESDQQDEAREALVFLVNAMNSNWKVPIGYFLIAGIDGTELASLIKKGLSLLHNTGAIVTSLTFDGHPMNINAAKALGVEILKDNQKSFIPHPITNEPVEVIIDPCHSLKLARNTFGAQGILYDINGRAINWNLLRELHDLQRQKGLHLANKIKNRHMYWRREKMKVNLAAQTLSRSTALALQYLRESVENGEQFKNSEATELFLLNINDAFDLLNKKVYYGSNFKSALRLDNKIEHFNRMDEIAAYIRGLKLSDNKTFIINSKLKTGFIGIIKAFESTKNMFMRYIENERPILSYILSYKFSQDHLELFFSAIRCRGGCNNNPSARQFKGSYRRLLIHNEIQASSNANCIPQDAISILTVSSKHGPTVHKIYPISFDLQDINENIELHSQSDVDPDLAIIAEMTIIDFDRMSEYDSDVIGHMAGFVLRTLYYVVHCDTCLLALECDYFISKLSQLKNNENALIGLAKPSQDLVSVCKITEIVIRNEEKIGRGHRDKNFVQRVTLRVMPQIHRNCFQSISAHMYEEVPTGNHVIALMKASIQKYCKIRIHHMTSITNDSFDTRRLRSMFVNVVVCTNCTAHSITLDTLMGRGGESGEAAGDAAECGLRRDRDSYYSQLASSPQKWETATQIKTLMCSCHRCMYAAQTWSILIAAAIYVLFSPLVLSFAPHDKRLCCFNKLLAVCIENINVMFQFVHPFCSIIAGPSNYEQAALPHEEELPSGVRVMQGLPSYGNILQDDPENIKRPKLLI